MVISGGQSRAGRSPARMAGPAAMWNMRSATSAGVSAPASIQLRIAVRSMLVIMAVGNGAGIAGVSPGWTLAAGGADLGADVLDVGCGTGGLLVAARQAAASWSSTSAVAGACGADGGRI